MTTPTARNRTAAKGDQNQRATHHSLAEAILAHAQSGREVIQDFCPLAESMEWQLGQQYLRVRSDPPRLALQIAKPPGAVAQVLYG